MTFPIRTLMLSAAALITVAALPAQAAPVRSSLPAGTQIVRYGDLDLRTPAGRAALHHRVQIAARRACGPVEMLGSPDAASYDACVDQAIRQGDARVAQLDTGLRYAAN